MPAYITKLTNWTYYDITEVIDRYGMGTCRLNVLDLDSLKVEAAKHGLNVELKATSVVFTRKQDILPHNEER